MSNDDDLLLDNDTEDTSTANNDEIDDRIFVKSDQSTKTTVNNDKKKVIKCVIMFIISFCK